MVPRTHSRLEYDPPRTQMGTIHTVVNLCLALCLALLAHMSAASARERPIRIIAFGDSLTAGYGLPPKNAFPVRLEAALKARGHNVAVVNAGVSGDTTAGGLARLDWAVPDDADAVIVELGANDALRALDPAAARKNLDAILTRIKAKGADVLLTGMRAPRNYGSEYTIPFDAIFPALARQHDTLYYPFFLEGVVLNQALNLDDSIHPNAKGIDIIVEGILPHVEELIARVKKRQAAATGK
jgi:acyl-CoA thioesterase-1